MSFDLEHFVFCRRKAVSDEVSMLVNFYGTSIPVFSLNNHKTSYILIENKE